MMGWISVSHSRPYNYMTHGWKFWRKEKKLKTLVFGVHSWINSVILQSVQKCLFMTTSWDSLKDIKPINKMKLHRNRENSIFNWLDFLKTGGDLRIWRCSYLPWGVWFIIPVMRSCFLSPLLRVFPPISEDEYHAMSIFLCIVYCFLVDKHGVFRQPSINVW